MKPHEQNTSPHRVPLTNDGARFLFLGETAFFDFIKKILYNIYTEKEKAFSDSLR